jgi:hypothetical protein
VTEDAAVPDADEVVYRWTMRGLYALAIALNAWVLWDQVKDTPEFQIRRRQWADNVRRWAAPVRERHLFRRHVNAVIFEATTVVEEASA